LEKKKIEKNLSSVGIELRTSGMTHQYAIF